MTYAIIYLAKATDLKGNTMNTWEKLENLTEQLGAQTVLDEVARALKMDELNAVLNYIAINWDANLEGWDWK